MFQSLGRPYFFHGSLPLSLPYFLKSWEQKDKSSVVKTWSEETYGFDVNRRSLTAQSLAWCNKRSVEGYAPAVVIVAVDVQHLLALNTQHTVALSDPASI